MDGRIRCGPAARRMPLLLVGLLLLLAACRGGGEAEPPPDEVLSPSELARWTEIMSKLAPQRDAAIEAETQPPPFAEPLPEGRKPWWYVPIVERDDTLPRFDGVLSGIRLGPDVERQLSACEVGWRSIAASETLESELAISPAYLPSGSHLTELTRSVACGDVVASNEAVYSVPPDPTTGRFGGTIQIYRFKGDRAFRFDYPEARTRAGAVGRCPAVIVAPLTADGFGGSAIVIDESWGLTLVRADGLTAVDLARVAEGLYSEVVPPPCSTETTTDPGLAYILSDPARCQQQIDKDVAFRASLGFRSDRAYVESLYADLSLSTGALHGGLFTSEEEEELRTRTAMEIDVAVIEAYFESTAPEQYAGLYLDNLGGGVFVVLFTGGEHEPALRPLVAYPQRLTFRRVEVSWLELEAQFAPISEAMVRRAPGTDAMISTSINVIENRIDIGVAEDTPENVRERLRTTFAGPAEVFVLDEEPIMLLPGTN